MTFEEKTISSEMLYDGKILNRRRDLVEVKDGGTSYREIIEHSGGVGVAVLEEKGFRSAIIEAASAVFEKCNRM